MARRKSERLLNLTIALLGSRSFVSRDRIREVVEGYRDLSDAAFERMFERDKDELRAMGVPIETGSNDPWFESDLGYRIQRKDFELPAITFTADEATVLGIAASVWQQASAADRTASALAKLRAAGLEPDVGRLTALAPRVSAREPAFDVLWQAVIERRAVQFHYRDADAPRIVEPWRVAWRNNSWYLLGHDRTRDAARMFKLARITGIPRPTGPAAAFDVPDELDLAQYARMLFASQSPDEQVIVAVRGNRAPQLRRRGEQVPVPTTLPPGFSAYRVALNRDLAVGELASFGADVLVIEPEQLRRRVIAHLREVLAARQATCSPVGAS